MPRNHGQSATGYRPWATPTRKEKQAPGSKHSKAEAHYTNDGTIREHCSICQHFVTPIHCTEVTGTVVKNGWCRFFRKA